MKLRARSTTMHGQTLHASALWTQPGELPMLFVRLADACAEIERLARATRQSLPVEALSADLKRPRE